MRLPISQYSNLGPILHHFGAIAGFCAPEWPPPLFHPNFGGVPVVPDCPCWELGVSPSRSLKLFGH